MEIDYYLNKEKNLYCRISDETKSVAFSLDYHVARKDWDKKYGGLEDKNEYYFTLLDFEQYLQKKYDELQTEGKDEILERLKNEALSFTKESGIEGIAKNMFNYFNKDNNVPKYEEFVQAFEKFSNRKKSEYKIEAFGSQISMHIGKDVFEMDTYEGLTSRLKSYIDNRAYENICLTSQEIWSEIYVDVGIEKQHFIPIMLQEWEIYWKNKYQDIFIKEKNLDALKQKSWRQFQVYTNRYDNSPDAIELAYEIDDDCLYPIAVLTMMQIFQLDTCYAEYCEYEFSEDNEWESVYLNDDCQLFYITQY